MTFLTPIAALIAAGITVPLLVAMYFLKLRRRNLDVSSTLLWKRAVQDLQVNSPFQKLRKNLLLLLQLILLALLLLAFAGPMWRGSVGGGSQTIILVDHSGSMNATDEKPTRLDRAKEMALRLVDNLASGDQAGAVMVVSFAHQAKVVQPFTSDQALLRSAIRGIEATDQRTNLEAALQLLERPAREAMAGGSAEELTVYVLSDGRVQRGEDLSLPGGRLVFERLGKRASNVAITSLSARRDFNDPRKVQAFAQLANFGQEQVTANLTLWVNDQVARVLSVVIPGAGAGESAPGTQPVQFELELSSGALLRVEHDSADDLESDDAAALVLAPPREVAVLLVTRGNAFLEKALEAVSVRRLVTMTPTQFEQMNEQQLAQSDLDVAVFDGYSPPRLPGMDAVYFNAVPPAPGLRLIGAAEGDEQAKAVLDWKRDEPLLNYVVLDDMLMSGPGRLALPPDAVVLATTSGGPVLAVVNDPVTRGRRHVVAAFDLLRTNWPMQVSFAVFMSNAVQWLGAGVTGGQGIAFSPGEVAAVPATSDVEYEGPMKLSGTLSGQSVVLPIFQRVGVYRSAAVAEPWDRLAVNLCDVVESDLRAVEQLQVGASPVRAQQRSLMALHEGWRWFVWAALAVLLLEWVVYTRRMHL